MNYLRIPRTQINTLLILFSITLFTEIAFCQGKDEKVNRADRELAAQAENYLTEFSNMRLNFVNPRVQKFLSEQMGLVVVGNRQTQLLETGNTVFEDYQKKESSSKKREIVLQVRYHIEQEGGELIVSSCTISGSELYVTDFFVKFWNITLTPNDPVYHRLSDRVVLVHKKDGTALVNIMQNPNK